MNPAILVPIVVAIVAPVGAYLLAARRMSGKVATSDADQLWNEARSIRDDYRDRLDQAASRQAELEHRVAVCEGQNTDLLRENFDLRTKVTSLEALVGQLRITITHLEETIATQAEELGEA